MKGKILKIVVAVLSAIGLAFFLRVSRIDQEDTIAISNTVSALVNYSIILFVIAVLAALIASLLGVLKNSEALKKTLLGIVTLAVVLLISYMLASDTQVIDANNEIIAEAGSQVSKYTSTAILVSLFLLLVGALFFVFDLVKSLIKS
ncbi:MAG: hypothetical protein ACK5H1_05815 [Tenacibaculum sp.]